ncbi:hypothetical protein [Sutcliffiella sp. NC1]|uniref:hypothetical protein n=1 Tax=Sutcliffiella sp. NC1 TaxID=3004096 RepID=UPI0022DD058F|nr:hypothetical protein [Sutcliffiella sp. NC1]WBL13911.1 hypothetical protein O1A01_18635 [Sutcliffiella sp. NC1]
MNTDENVLDRTLKRLEYDTEWDIDRAEVTLQRLKSDIAVQKRKANIFKRFYVASILSSVALIAFFIVSNVQTIKDTTSSFLNMSGSSTALYYEENDRIILTDKGLERTVFPVDAEKHMERIIGAPELSMYLTEDKTLTGQAVYMYALGGSISIHTQKNERTVDETMELLLPHKKFPATSYTSEEIQIGNERGVLTQSNQEYGGVHLQVVTENFIYYFYIYNDLTIKTSSDEGIQLMKDDLIQLASLLNYENEHLSWK